MIAVIFDEAATQFGQDYHPERPARLMYLQIVWGLEFET